MLKTIWEWVKSACVIIVLLMILSGIISGMYFGEYDKGLFYLAMYYVFFCTGKWRHKSGDKGVGKRWQQRKQN